LVAVARAAVVAVSLLLGYLTLSGSFSLAATVDAKAIVDRVDRLLRGESSEGELTMSVVDSMPSAMRA